MNWALPSEEPLSTTMISLSPNVFGLETEPTDIAAIKGGRYFSNKSRPFQLGITTLAALVFGRVLGAGFGRGVIAATASVISRAMADSARAKGAIRATGRPFRSRQVMASSRPRKARMARINQEFPD